MDLKLHSIDEAPEGSKPLLKKAQEGFGMIPNLLKVFAESPAVTEGYLKLNELLEQTDFSPEEQQLLLLAVSVKNECHYCVAAHSTHLRNQLNIDDEIIDAVRNNVSVPDNKLNALVTYTQTVVEKRGFVSEEDMQAFLNAGYSKRHLLEVNLAVAMKTLSNYTNHIARTPVDEPFEAEKLDFGKVTA